VVFVGAKKCQGAKMYICSDRGDSAKDPVCSMAVDCRIETLLHYIVHSQGA